MKKIISLILALIMSFSCFSLISVAEETETAEHLTEVPEGYVGVYTKDDLDNIKLDMMGSYILMNDIVFEDSDYEKGGSFYNSGKGWQPIGTTENSFSGVFDGNGYKIYNLYINNAENNYIGLFGYCNTATIKNLSLTGAHIVGNKYVGGIAGYIYGKANSDCGLFNCNVNGKIIGQEYVGGITGISNNALSISYCNVDGEVTGELNVGGIAGKQFLSPGKKQTLENYISYSLTNRG